MLFISLCNVEMHDSAHYSEWDEAFPALALAAAAASASAFSAFAFTFPFGWRLPMVSGPLIVVDAWEESMCHRFVVR